MEDEPSCEKSTETGVQHGSRPAKEDNPVFSSQTEFERELSAIRDQVMAYLRCIGCPASDIEDGAQVILMRLKYNKTPKEDGQPAYLWKAARNQIRDFIRRKNCRVSTVSIELFNESQR